MQLVKNGWSPKKITNETEIPYYSLLSWIPKEYRRRYKRREKLEPEDTSRFTPVHIRQNQVVSAVTVTDSNIRPPLESGTVTVTLPGGAVIQGVTAEFLRAWLGDRSL